MNLRQLETFVQVAELGGFTAAAEVLQVAQPALSRQVRALELELRQPLFNRHGRGVTLTEAGKRLLAHSRGILHQVQRVRRDMETERDAVTGLLSLGLPPSVGRSVTVPLYEGFSARFPRASLKLVEGLSSALLEALVQGRLDCAVVYDAVPAANVTLRPLLDEQLFLVSARPPGRSARDTPGAPVTLAELAALPLAIPGRPNAIRMRLDGTLAQAGLQPRVALEVESVPAMLDLVRRHALHAVLSLAAVRSSGDAGAFVVRAIPSGARQQPLCASLAIAISAQRPGGLLLDGSVALLEALLRQQLAPP